MTARIVVRGRTAWCDRAWTEAQRRPAPALPRGPKGAVVDCARAVPPDAPESPFRTGVPVEVDGVVHRQVERLDPREGWATSGFWQRRWCVPHSVVLKLAEAGLVDAAVERGSAARRYRCRDEQRVLRSELVRRARAKRWSEEANARQGKRPRRR